MSRLMSRERQRSPFPFFVRAHRCLKKPLKRHFMLRFALNMSCRGKE
jgi:hypothetical protein